MAPKASCKTWKLLPILLVLSGCSLLPSQTDSPKVQAVEVVTVAKNPVRYHPPLPNAVATLPVEWTVLTPETMSEYLEDLREGNAPTNAFYGLTTKGYENLSQNMAEVTRYIRQVLSIIEYYRRVDSEQEEQHENE